MTAMCAAGFLITSCAGRERVRYAPPSIPALEVVQKDGLVCFTENDAKTLAKYIVDLERAAGGQ